MITIEEFDSKYSEKISQIIIQNLIEINCKDYGLEYIQSIIGGFSPSQIDKTFSKRVKVFVALENGIVVGTGGLDKSWYTENEYYILSVFVDIAHHKQGIGRRLIEKIEDFARQINAEKIVVPASIFGCEFYHKLGYNYKNGKKELNDNKMYIMEKLL